MAIDKLPSVSAFAAADLVPVFSSALGNDARGPISLLASLIQTLISSLDDKITQYSAPNATGFNVQIAPPVNGGSVFLLLTPAAGYAAGTITLPAQANCVDKQELLVTCTQIVTALTVAGNGSTVNGAPTTLAAANAFFRLRFDGVLKAWYRVG